jgi:hypothetical protein
MLAKKMNLTKISKKEQKELKGGAADPTIMEEIRDLTGCHDCGSIFVVFGLG